MAVRTAPYGSWKSPITADMMISGTLRLDQLVMDGDDVYFTEGRADEGGRQAIVRWTAGRTEDAIPRDFNARTRVHEYGGASFTVHQGTVYFSNFADNHIYVGRQGDTPRPLTTDANMRYADFVVDEPHNRLIAVREDHTKPAPSDVVNTIVAVDLDTGENRVLLSGNDFYSNPRLSPDGTKLSWMTWNHPNMPWDGTELYVADIRADGSVGDATRVAGGQSESIFQPEWSPEGVLYFVSDRTGWWNLYRAAETGVEHVIARDAEFGEPQWVFGERTYAFVDADTLVCIYTENGVWNLGTVDVRTNTLTEMKTPYTYMEGITASRTHAVLRVGSTTEFTQFVAIDLASGAVRVLRKSADLTLDEGYVSPAKSIEFPTENGLTAHGFYYAPRNKDYQAPEGERPPLIVYSHGGPTSATTGVLMLGIQYWTSRGFAVLDVNYGGSTGYGRAYRERLKGQWGVVDVDDCCNGALYLVRAGLADENRLAIAGGSAGGYTTLAALTGRDVFKAGASHFGVSDLTLFAGDTHKFESRYMDGLIGPYPERADLYRERSPLTHMDGLSCPVIFFQGLDDKVVPPSQAEVMVEALRHKGIPVAYIAYEGEGHGFRMGKNIKRTVEGELYFYAKVFGFTLAEDVEPVEIENL